jgi:hypothetical protein
MPAAPLIAMGVSAAFSAYQAHKQGQMADEQMNQYSEQSGLAKEMAQFGKEQYNISKPAQQQAMKYYQTLATGNRGAINNQLAPQYGQVTDYYRGAEKGMESKMAPGPGRDQAMAEMFRQKAGQLGMMPMASRNAAVGSLADMSKTGMAQSSDFYGGGQRGLYGAGEALGKAHEAQMGAMNSWGSLGNSLMGTILPWLQGMKGGQKPLQSKQISLPLSGLPSSGPSMSRGFGGS